MAQSEANGVFEVPDNFKPSRLVGVRVQLTGSDNRILTIDRAYTLPRRLCEKGSGRKRVKFLAS